MSISTIYIKIFKYSYKEFIYMRILMGCDYAKFKLNIFIKKYYILLKF